MTLEEANSRLKTVQLTEEQLLRLDILYHILNLDKDDFCRIVDVVGVQKLTEQRERYKEFFMAKTMQKCNILKQFL